MKRFYLIFLILAINFLPGNLIRADYNDSLDNYLSDAFKAYEVSKMSNSLEEQAKRLNTIAKIYRSKGENEKALNYYLLALEIRKKLPNPKYIAQSYNNAGFVYSDLGQFDKALQNYYEAYKIKSELKDSTGMGIVLNNIANIKFSTSNYEEAIQYFQYALDIFEKINYSEGIASCLNGYGLVFENLMNFEKALDFYNKALKIASTLKNKKQYADILNNLGNVYTLTRNYDKAIDFYIKGLIIRKELNDQLGIASSLNNIGLIFKIRKEYLNAISYFRQAMVINKTLKNNYETGLNLNAIGESYLEINKNQEALNYMNQSLKLAVGSQNKELVQLCLSDLSKIYSNLSQYEKAFNLYKQSITIRDTLENLEIKKRINELQTKYETEKKEHKLQILSKKTEIQKLQLNKTKYFIFGLTILIAFLIMIGFLIIRHNKLKSEHNSIILEQKLLRIQMNPHFIFNSLTSIQSFLFEKDKLMAGKYISDFASLMRLILENSREEFISLEKEITTLKYYLELQKLRYENKFDYSIFIDPLLNPEFDVIPPMLGQPFVENSIKHGILNKDTKGQIDIRMNKNDEILIFEIEDNGIGRKKAKQLKEEDGNKHVSLALSITKERLQNINKNKSKKINFEIIDLEKNNQASGTLVKFEIPIS